MYQSLEIFQTAGRMARHAGARQALVATNVANADTPGYLAKAMPAFKEVFDENLPTQMRVTRAGHFTGDAARLPRHMIDETGAEPSPNGNSVSIEEEMFRAVEISREHNRALTIYRHAMTVLRSTLGR